MKKIIFLFVLFVSFPLMNAQELLAEVSINHQQVQGSNVQLYKTLEKSLRDFINNTSWTGKRLQNFEKVKCNFAIIINSKEGNNFKASLVVQASRPVYNSTYNTPLLNINDKDFPFEYTENENLIFNERQFSGKNLIDVISFYVYVILGYDGDSFKMNGGQQWFEKAMKISQNSQNQRFGGWSVTEGLKTRAQLIDNLLKQENNTLRSVWYNYHRLGLDNLWRDNKNQAKKSLFDTLLRLKAYDNNFGMNYPFAIFMQAKADEIYEIFALGTNTNININELKTMMQNFEPAKSQKWSKWK